MKKFRHDLPPLSSLLPFEAAARLGSFSSAAEELNVTQAAISRQVRALEQNLNLSLFRREHRAVHLTADGRHLREAIASGLGEIAQAARELRHANDQSADVTVFTELALATNWLVPRLGAFEQRHADIEIQVNCSNRPADAGVDRFDVALQTSGRTMAKFRKSLTVPEQILPVCAPGYLKSRDLASTATSSNPATFLRLDDAAVDWLDWTEWAEATGSSLPDTMAARTYNRYLVLLQAAVEGRGIALGWHHSIERLLDLGLLECVGTDALTVDDGVSVYVPGSSKPSRNAAVFIDWLGDELQASRPG